MLKSKKTEDHNGSDMEERISAQAGIASRNEPSGGGSQEAISVAAGHIPGRVRQGFPYPLGALILTLPFLLAVGNRFEEITFYECISISALVFFVSAGTAFLFCFRKPRPQQYARWKRAIASSAILFLVVCALYTVMRHELVLIPIPALFYPAGSAMGGTMALTLTRS